MVELRAYLDDREGWTLADAEWDEIEASIASIERGEGIVVDDVDSFIDELDPSASP